MGLSNRERVAKHRAKKKQEGAHELMKAKNRVCNARLRAKKENELKTLEQEVAKYKDMLCGINLNDRTQGAQAFTEYEAEEKKDSPLKARPRKNYSPPQEVLERMSKEELSQWRKERRNERKRIRNAEVALAKKVKLESLQNELAILKELYESVMAERHNITPLPITPSSDRDFAMKSDMTCVSTSSGESRDGEEVDETIQDDSYKYGQQLDMVMKSSFELAIEDDENGLFDETPKGASEDYEALLRDQDGLNVAKSIIQYDDKDMMFLEAHDMLYADCAEITPMPTIYVEESSDIFVEDTKAHIHCFSDNFDNKFKEKAEDEHSVVMEQAVVCASEVLYAPLPSLFPGVEYNTS